MRPLAKSGKFSADNILPIENRRYGRLKTCATTFPMGRMKVSILNWQVRCYVRPENTKGTI